MQQTQSLSLVPTVLRSARRVAARTRPAWNMARACARLAWIAAQFTLETFEWLWLCVRANGAPGWRERAKWVQRSAQRAGRVFDLDLQVTGPVPKSGLLVSNHLSYLDIIVLAALAPAVFVAKREVRSWPVFGPLTRMAGTLFVHREKRADTARLAPELARLLDASALVVVFPEGTSSDGSEVLPFRSSLLEAAVWRGTAVHTAYLEYELDGGDAGTEVCYWGTMTLFPHLMNLLGKARVRARVVFSETTVRSADRKELARAARDEVLRLRNQLSRGDQPQPAA